VDPSLWLLTKLRVASAYRRWKRSLAKPRGILVTIVFILLFMPSVVVAVAMPFLAPPTFSPSPIERFGPIGFMVLTVLSLLFSSGETALYFTPAEVDFLFTGPFRRRQLVGYKLIVIMLASVVSALFFGLMGATFSPRFVSAFSGALLALMFFQLSQMVVGLGLNLMGTLAWSRARRWSLMVLLGAIVLAVLPSRESLLAMDWKAFGLAVEQSPVTLAILTPFRWFINVYVARTWSGLFGYGALALGVDLILVGMVFALDAGYLEASAQASSRLFARTQKAMGGGGTVKLVGRRLVRFRSWPPRPVWWGGVGPNLWRQMISALADPSRIIVLTIAIAGALWFIASSVPRGEAAAQALLPISLSMALPITFLLSILLAYDFRGDVDVIETLKMLPISPTRIAFSQVLTPTLLATAIESVAACGLIAGAGGPQGHWAEIGLGLTLLLPANLFYYGVENVLFLWYPTRIVAGQFDGMAVVRQMLMLLAKGIAVGLAGGVAAAFGAVGYFASGRQVGPALILAWVATSAMALGLLPLVGRAFLDFDISRDVPA